MAKDFLLIQAFWTGEGNDRWVGGEGMVAHDMFQSPIMNLSVIESGVMILQLYWPT